MDSAMLLESAVSITTVITLFHLWTPEDSLLCGERDPNFVLNIAWVGFVAPEFVCPNCVAVLYKQRQNRPKPSYAA